MEGLELREHQLRCVEALKVVDKICEEEGLKYFLIAGSCLGAVRHKGFIPWDDDVDIIMPIKDYNRFIKIAPKKLEGKFIFKHVKVDDTFPTLSGRILETMDEQLITVFPLVKMSDDPKERKKQWTIRKIYSPIWQRKVGYKVPKREMSAKKRFSIAVSAVLALFMSKERVLKILSDNERRYEDREVELCNTLYGRYSMEKEMIRSEWAKEIIRVPFEDMEAPIMKEYDAYLKHIYGDYMTPPPEKERVTVHFD